MLNSHIEMILHFHARYSKLSSWTFLWFPSLELEVVIWQINGSLVEGNEQIWMLHLRSFRSCRLLRPQNWTDLESVSACREWFPSGRYSCTASSSLYRHQNSGTFSATKKNLPTAKSRIKKWMHLDICDWSSSRYENKGLIWNPFVT